MTSRRLFLASFPNLALRAELQRFFRHHERLAASTAHRIRWVAPEHWHLTWLFMGNVLSQSLPDIEQRLQTALQNFSPVHAALASPQAWPNARKSRTLVWPVEPSLEIAAMAQTLRQTLPEFRAEQAFKPHVTIARLKEPQGIRPGAFALPPDVAEPPGRWRIEEIALVQSTLTPEGPIYETLRVFRSFPG